jgi:hypothetical protein
MLELHQLIPPATEAECKTDVSRRHERVRGLLREASLEDSKILNLASDVITFLETAEQWTVNFSGKFRLVLESWGALAQKQAHCRCFAFR